MIGSEISEGVQLPLSDVANLMMVLSDNSATNMLLERFTADAVMPTSTSSASRPPARCEKSWANAERRGISAAGKLPENQKYGLGVSTPHDMVTILEKLERGEIVSPDASKQILEILRRCQDGNGIRRRSPA